MVDEEAHHPGHYKLETHEAGGETPAFCLSADRCNSSRAGHIEKTEDHQAYAFTGPKPIDPSVEAMAVMPWDVVMFWMPKSTLQLETTTSFWAMPAISATTICQ